MGRMVKCPKFGAGAGRMAIGTNSLSTSDNAYAGVAALSTFSYYSWFWFSREVRPRA